MTAAASPPTNPPPSLARDVAVDALLPSRFGLVPDRAGWTKVSAAGRLTFAPLGWRHALAPLPRDDEGASAVSPLALLVALQAEVWGMPPADLVPANVLAVIPETGGSVIAAYDPQLGLTPQGWLGFAIAFGARSGVLVSHMLGVRPDNRGAANIGWLLKLVQAYEALRAGHDTAVWTFDPMRGANARLNLEKLGATVEHFTLDKYGALPTTLYGAVPSDRFTAHWDLRSPTVVARLRAVHDGTDQSHDPVAIDRIPEAAALPPRVAASALPHRLRYRIPDDIDRLAAADPSAAARWRADLRDRLGPLLTTSQGEPSPTPGADPLAWRQTTRPGPYLVDGFASHVAADGERRNHYLLRRRATPPTEEAPS